MRCHQSCCDWGPVEKIQRQELRESFVANRLGVAPAVSGRSAAPQLTHRSLSRYAARCHVRAAAAKRKIVFLGTPEVAADVLLKLLQASQAPGSSFEVSLVVSQPGKPRGRGNSSTPLPSPVEALARAQGLLDEHITCPARANEAPFLERLLALQPDLCVTAAYGNLLPQRFLDIPAHGTLNIHPSLLPRYRGAAPVQRALQDGVSETGVTLAYTVLRCDAGPVLAQRLIHPDPDVQAPDMLASLFQLGAGLLLDELPSVFDGTARSRAVPQDESATIHAPKPAVALHRKVCGFAGWPGTSAAFKLVAASCTDDSDGMPLDLKVIRTTLDPNAPTAAGRSCGEVVWQGEEMYIMCGDSTALRVLQVQPTAKKVMSVKDFRNGLRDKRVVWKGYSSC
ncbi:MAG: hypothetical protein WDW38_008811 [Sanguina aurantia]